jgi:DNA polymerase III subunit delta'
MSVPDGPFPAWLAPPVAALTAAERCGRLPHALLIHEAPGAGGEWLAHWAAQLVLCERPAAAPCGECAGCRRALAWQHPDLLRVAPLEESRQLRIEQVRELSFELSLTSHAGGYKVGILTPADSLNRFAANALLKTLEEPPPRTLLILVATQPSALPATVLSRCQRVRVRAPARADSIAWLTQLRGAGDWNAALDVQGEAPMLVAGSDPAALAAVGAEMRRALEAFAAGSSDPPAAAERWARSEPALRLRCFENWLTERIRGAAAGGCHLTELRAGTHLPVPEAFLNIRRLFGLLDEVRELRATLDAPLNRALALEALLRRLAGRGEVGTGT